MHPDRRGGDRNRAASGKYPARLPWRRRSRRWRPAGSPIAIDAHHGRIVKRTGDGSLIEFRSVVDAVRCAIEVQNGLVERNVGVPAERRIEFRVGIHLGDVVEEADGDLMGDGVNIAARLEGVCEPGGICLSEDAYRQVRDKLKEEFADLGNKELRNIARPVRAYALQIGGRSATSASPSTTKAKAGPPRLSIVVLPFANLSGEEEQDYFVDGVTESLTTDLSRISGAFVIARNTAFAYKASRPTRARLGANSACATFSRAAYNAAAIGCASMCSLLTRRPAPISGPSALISP
ncbi:MAG TPA: adenylate/guanylate cyclase domain-containing protein [Roseiarcus sp.]|nr:adenylate/guanylate cyclase domain-containing protein [Roseiarcus sp.]